MSTRTSIVLATIMAPLSCQQGEVSQYVHLSPKVQNVYYSILHTYLGVNKKIIDHFFFKISIFFGRLR